MFEDSTFESTGRLHTRSRGWMIATFAFNASILLALILVPLIYPAALPRMALAMLMEAPATPAEEQKPVVRPERTMAAHSEIDEGRIQAPPMIPTHSWIPSVREEPGIGNLMALAGPPTLPGTGCDPVNCSAVRPDVRLAVTGPAHISQGVAQGLLIHRVVPEYPAVPRAAHIGGTVVLQATISKSGTIENLRVASGPELLRQAAVDAVKQWRYRPYLLNGEPVEVETTVNVEFRLQ
jgi:periplasmic protein TonB